MWFIYLWTTRTNFQRSFKYWFVSIKLVKKEHCSYPQKSDKQILKNYLLVSLLPICGKILERLIFNEMFNFLLENNLYLPNHSGLKSEGSCIKQLLSITYKIYNSFDEKTGNEKYLFRISKAFD